MKIAREQYIRPLPLMFLLLLSAASGCSEPSTGGILVVNKSSSPIARAEVKVCDHTLLFEGLQPRKSQHSFFSVEGECKYKINVTFSDQPPLIAELGYLTSGFDWLDYLVITDDEVLLNPKGYKGEILPH